MNRTRPVLVVKHAEWIRTFEALTRKAGLELTHAEMTLSHHWRALGMTPVEATHEVVTRRLAL